MERGKELKILEDANEIQKQLLDVIDNNNKLTSGHNKLMLWLTGVIVFLTIITLFSNYSKKGRYAGFSGQRGGFVILDTKTSQMWGRIEDKMVNMGTIKKPLYEVIEIDEEKQISKMVTGLEETEKSFDRALKELLPEEKQ